MALALLPIAAVIALSSITIAASTVSASGSSLKSSDRKARYGRTVRLRGSVPGVSNAKVRIAFRRARHQTWRTVRYTRTGASGRFRVRVRARESGAYRAEPVAGTGRSDETQPAPTDGADVVASDSSDGSTAEVRASRSKPLRVVSRTHARVRRHAVTGHGVRVRGRVNPDDAHRLVKVDVGGRTLRTRTKRGGRFETVWHPPHAGRFRMRVRASGDRVAAGSRDRAGRVTVFRPVAASWYGPGFYGSRTACGQTLEPSTLGVANKTMPCGRKLTLRYRGRQVNVRVIDRGPYSGDREFDLTAATKQRLGFGSTGTVLSSK